MTKIKHPEITVQLSGQDGNAFIDYARKQSADGKVTHIRIRSEKIDHYTIVKRITKDKIKFYDSSDLEDILLKNIDTTNCRKYQICLRQVYFLSLESV